ncbi:MAG: Hemin import ATP-binding protein HmuV [Alphaproteobacteria bacterium MarineAlpha2_Bin1]|nr:MAG: Hemin import ATP-binding protein HmuV [Alphaproteobacteria bacterium MarineAlpha2_Bin1]
MDRVSLDIRKKNILSEINILFRSGVLTGIVGPNGSGKTTILKIIANILTTYSGSICYNNRNYKKYSRLDLAKKISYLPQEITIAWPLSVYNVIMAGLIPFPDKELNNKKKDKRVNSIIEELNLKKFALKSVNILSTGERSRVCLARALVGNPNFLLADEPVSSLDPYYQLNILELILKRVKSGMGAIIIMHDLDLARRFCDNVVVIRDGKVIFNDRPHISLDNKNLKEIFAVEYDGNKLILS